MVDPISASALRADVYNVLDRVLATGEPVEILRLVPVVAEAETGVPRDLGALFPARPGFVHGDAGDLDQVDAAGRWNPDRAIDPT